MSTILMGAGVQETTTVPKKGTVMTVIPQDFTDDILFTLQGRRVGRLSLFREEAKYPSGYRTAKNAVVSRIIEGEDDNGEPVIRVYGIPQGGNEEMLLVSLN